MSESCGNPEFFGRNKTTISLSQNQEIDMSLVVAIRAELQTDTPCVIDGRRLETAGDVYCEESHWHYVDGSKLTVEFDNGGSSSNNLRITITRLVPNPNFYMSVFKEKV